MRHPDHFNRAETSADSRDRGSAMVLTLLVMTLVTALSTTIALITINNLQASASARQAGAALGSADGGVAQGLSHLRTAGVRGLHCSPTCGAANPWGDEANPASVTVGGAAGQSYRVWIEPVAPYPAHDPGLYRIHSTGTAAGAATRPVVADVQVTTSEVPKGIFARTINGGGDASVTRQSIFSTGCVYNRSKIEMVPGEIDLAYGIPIGVHSSQIITDSNGTGQYCPTTNRPIHRSGNGGNAVELPCNPAYPYDQDKLGGRLVAGDGCHDARMVGTGAWAKYYSDYDVDGDGTKDPSSRMSSDGDLFRLFGIRSPALTQAQLDQLRTLAHAQGNHWTQSSGWTTPDDDNAVMFFDLTTTDPGGTVDLNDIVDPDVNGFNRGPDRDASSTSCAAKSLIIVIEGGNVKLNSNQNLAASLFLTSSAPHGQVFKANGTSNFIGTIYADTVNLVGTADISMDECFLANLSPALMNLAVTSYREEDRGLD